jgi:hypothetical protein
LTIGLIDTSAIPIVLPILIRIANNNFASDDTTFSNPAAGLLLHEQLALVGGDSTRQPGIFAR